MSFLNTAEKEEKKKSLPEEYKITPACSEVQWSVQVL